jgi:hypothetical protein
VLGGADIISANKPGCPISVIDNRCLSAIGLTPEKHANGSESINDKFAHTGSAFLG